MKSELASPGSSPNTAPAILLPEGEGPGARLVHTLTVNTQDKNLNDLLHFFWELELMGVFAPTDMVLEEFEESVTFKDGRYVVSTMEKPTTNCLRQFWSLHEVTEEPPRTTSFVTYSERVCLNDMQATGDGHMIQPVS